MSLSKLHVRFIQSQKNFILQQEGSKDEKLPIAQLYVKDTNNFYLALMQESALAKNVNLVFNEKTPALNLLECSLKASALDKGSEDFEDALLFFQLDESKVKALYALELTELKDQ